MLHCYSYIIEQFNNEAMKQRKIMTLTLNNRTESFDLDVLTITELLKLKNFTFKFLVIKINGQLIKKEKYSEAKVYAGDKVDIIHMISGG